MLFRPIALLAALVPAVLGAFSINNPVSSTVWKVGTQVTVTWVAAGTGLDATASWPVSIMFGNTAALTLAGDVGTAKESDGKFSFTVPTTWGNSNTYAVRVGTTYSSAFTISGSATNATVPTTTASTTPTTAPSSTTAKPTTSTTTVSPTSTGAAKASSASTSSTSLLAFVPVLLLALAWF